MPLKSSRRLPKKYARRASPDAKRFVKSRMQRKKRRRTERIRRLQRRVDAVRQTLQASALRICCATGILITLIALGAFLFSPILHVREVQVTRLSPRLDIEEVQEVLASVFGKHLFFLSSFDIAALLNEAIVDIDTVRISKKYPSTLHVRIALDPLIARLRIHDPDADDTVAIGTGSTIDYVTDKGVYVSTTAVKDKQILPEISIVDWGVRPEPGITLIVPALLERMNTAELMLLRQFGQEVSRRTVYVRAQEFHVRIGTTTLWFDMQSSVEEQMQRYRAFLEQVPLDQVEQYIDLRVGDRVIYY